MKTLFAKIRPSALATLFALTLTTAAVAQKRDVPTPPKAGYWVIETARQPNRQTIVRFYNNANKLIYQEDLTGKRLNIRRAKTVIRLNGALDQAMTQWASTQHFQSDQNLVAAQFRK
ncbi:hypothetical protein GCM10023189_56130 [Nibrella saemangeumensis]|uniref:Uncharacterized protein n=1 Tax=Nibrella saemangeumensis TaxID=1084526 RepID=A0ABP8NQQ8_9BACT